MFPKDQFPELLVGLDVSDDAAVYKIDSDKAVILTVDFITPVVDDPFDFGAVAAANALSDVFAMGGEAAAALNICCFPPAVEESVIADILRGGAETVLSAGAVIAGGHTIDDEEPKYGLSVMGLIDPDKIMTKAAFQPGHRLVLTKSLGSGIITTAAKGDMADTEHTTAAVASMKMLNRQASRIFAECGVRGCTDVTGFGLLGHSTEAADKSGVTLDISMHDLRYLPGAAEYAEQCLFPAGARNNLDCYSCSIRFGDSVDEIYRMLLATPETSGGLLASVPDAVLRRCMDKLAGSGVPAACIGSVSEYRGVSVALDI